MAGYIVDQSAWGRRDGSEAVREVIDSLDNVIYTCLPQRLEFFFSARDQAEHTSMIEYLDSVGVLLEPISELVEISEQIQSALAARGKLRSVGPIDVMIAAYAIAYRLTVLHYDSDFDDHLGAAIPEFRQRWVVPRGSI
jgi:predicted nucleic acid-binding protein